MTDRRKKILVTGASGFVGRALIEKLLDRPDFEVFGMTGKSRIGDALENSPAKNVFSVDVADPSTFPQSDRLKNCEIVIHAAGLAHQFGKVTKRDFWNVNVGGTENMCRFAAANGVKHLVLISSVAVYGNYRNAVVDESFDCRPEGLYAESKFEGENAAREICEAENIRLTILRPATVIGEGDRGNTARLVRLIEKGRFIWVGTGENYKSLIYKDDLALGILKAIDHSEAFETEIYNLTAAPVSMRTVVETVSRALQKKTPRLKIPENLVRMGFLVNRTPVSFEPLRKIERTFEKWISDDIFSGEKFRKRFGFKPEIAVREGLRRQVEYHLNRKDKPLE